MPELDQVRSSIETLESQRSVLGDVLVDQALAPLLRRARELDQDGHLADAGERKHVTVMFADVSGFTKLSEAEDPEEIRNLLNACFARMADVVARYGGYIDKFIGDELMVLFGAPRSIEDHASRALHAALAMREALAAFAQQHSQLLARDLDMHFGINSGVVIAGAMGVDARREYTVMGDAVNVAARLAAHAEAGEILVGADTRRLIGDGFVFDDPVRIELEGRSEAVEVQHLLSGRADARGARDDLAAGVPMVGRDWELHALRDILGEVIAQRRARSVTIAGNAGIGKTRMLREFRAWVESAHPGTAFLLGEALPHMTMTPYFLVASSIRNALGVREGESVGDIRARLRNVLVGAGIDESEPLDAIQAMLGIEAQGGGLENLPPQDRKDRIFAASRDIILALAKAAPVVLAFEDLHWADELSNELIDYLVSGLAASPVLVLMSTRPIVDEESIARQIDLRLPRNTHTRLALPELDAESSEALVRRLAPGIERWPRAVEAIVMRGQGNPFFVESILGVLVDRGVLVSGPDGVALSDPSAAADVPETVWDVLADRIDRLPPDEKRVVQMSAIVGRLFWEDLVRNLAHLPVHKHLQALNQRDFVDRVGRAAFSEDWEWAFKHVLVQEVAYSSLLRETRRAGHRAAAEWLEERVGDRRPEFATLLAYHYRRAEVWSKTAEFAEAAGDRAVSLFAHREAKDAYLQALEALDRLPTDPDVQQRRVDATLKLARAAVYSPTEEVLAALERAKAITEETGDRDRQLRVLTATASWLYVAGRSRPAVEVALKAVALASETGIEEPLVIPYNILGRATYALGDYGRCVELIEKSIALAEQYQSDLWSLGLGLTQGFLGMAYAFMGRFAEGDQLAQASLRAAEEKRDRRQIATSLMYIGVYHAGLGNLVEGPAHLERAVALCEQTGDLSAKYVSLGFLGQCHVLRGEIDAAIRCLDESLAIAAELDSSLYVSIIEAYRAGADLCAGRTLDAVARARRACDIGKETRQQTCEAEALRMMGWALHHSGGDGDEAENSLRRAVELHRAGSGMAFATRAALDLGAYLRLVGRHDDADAVESAARADAARLSLHWLPVPPPAPGHARAAG